MATLFDGTAKNTKFEDSGIVDSAPERENNGWEWSRASAGNKKNRAFPESREGFFT